MKAMKHTLQSQFTARTDAARCLCSGLVAHRGGQADSGRLTVECAKDPRGRLGGGGQRRQQDGSQDGSRHLARAGGHHSSEAMVLESVYLCLCNGGHAPIPSCVFPSLPGMACTAI